MPQSERVPSTFAEKTVILMQTNTLTSTQKLVLMQSLLSVGDDAISIKYDAVNGYFRISSPRLFFHTGDGDVSLAEGYIVAISDEDVKGALWAAVEDWWRRYADIALTDTLSDYSCIVVCSPGRPLRIVRWNGMAWQEIPVNYAAHILERIAADSLSTNRLVGAGYTPEPK